MASDLANEFDPAAIRPKLKQVTSYDYSKPGLM